MEGFRFSPGSLLFEEKWLESEDPKTTAYAHLYALIRVVERSDGWVPARSAVSKLAGIMGEGVEDAVARATLLFVAHATYIEAPYIEQAIKVIEPFANENRHDVAFVLGLLSQYKPAFGDRASGILINGARNVDEMLYAVYFYYGRDVYCAIMCNERPRPDVRVSCLADGIIGDAGLSPMLRAPALLFSYVPAKYAREIFEGVFWWARNGAEPREILQALPAFDILGATCSFNACTTPC